MIVMTERARIGSGALCMSSKQQSESRIRATILGRGFEMIGPYLGHKTKTAFRCLEHNEIHDAFPTSLLYKVGGMRCCGAAKVAAYGLTRRLPQERVAERLRVAGFELLGGFVNVATAVSIRCLEHGLVADVAPRQLLGGKKMRCCGGARTSARFAGQSRRHESIVRKAANGTTAGRAGYFYVARLTDGTLKFGSAVNLSLNDRMRLLGHEFGMSAEVLLAARVPDAGAYEAHMIDIHREHWLHGEVFRDFIGPALATGRPTAPPAEED